MNNEGDISLTGKEVKITLGFDGVDLKVSYNVSIDVGDLTAAKIDADNIVAVLGALVEDFLNDYNAAGQEEAQGD